MQGATRRELQVVCTVGFELDPGRSDPFAAIRRPQLDIRRPLWESFQQEMPVRPNGRTSKKAGSRRRNLVAGQRRLVGT